MKIKIEIDKLPPLARECFQMNSRIMLAQGLRLSPEQIGEKILPDLVHLWQRLTDAKILDGDVQKLLKKEGTVGVIPYMERAAHTVVLQQWETGQWHPETVVTLDFPMLPG